MALQSHVKPMTDLVKSRSERVMNVRIQIIRHNENTKIC